MALVKDLEAEMISIDDPDVAEGIKRVAYQRGVTQIILGKTPKNAFLSLLQGPSLLDRLAQECKDVDIHVIRQGEDLVPDDRKWFSNLWSKQTKLTDYLYAVIWVSLFAVLSKIALPLLGHRVTEVLFLSGISFLSFYFRRGPFFFATALAGLVWYFFLMDQFSLREIAILLLFSSIVLFFGFLVSRLRMQRELLLKSEKTTFALDKMIQHLGSDLSIQDTLAYIQQNLPKVVEGTYRFALKGDESALLKLDEQEKAAAIWALEKGKEAGWSTETLPVCENLYMPIRSQNEVIGVLIYRPSRNHSLSFEGRNLLFIMTEQLASYIERSYAKEKERQHENLKQMEIIHKSVIDRFYNVFEDPLLKIKGAIDEIKPSLSHQEVSKIKEIDSSVAIFGDMLEGISAMAKLSEGMIPLQKSSHDLKEVVDECCVNLKKASKGHEIKIHIPHALPPISYDYYLIHILLQNVLLYVLKQAPEGSSIDIEITRSDEFIHLSISGEVMSGWNGSMPLGLTVAKTIAELHHGMLRVENLSDQRIQFTLSLPVLKSPSL